MEKLYQLFFWKGYSSDYAPISDEAKTVDMTIIYINYNLEYNLKRKNPYMHINLYFVNFILFIFILLDLKLHSICVMSAKCIILLINFFGSLQLLFKFSYHTSYDFCKVL